VIASGTSDAGGITNMKSFTLLRISFGLSLSLIPASAVIAPAQSEPAVVERGPHDNTWMRVVEETLPNGKVIQRERFFTELCSGLNYWSDEQNAWMPSKEEIEIINGFAVARQGQHKSIWAGNAHSAGAFDIQTLDGKRLRGHVLGLAFTSRKTGESYIVAETKDCQGEVAGTQVIYRDVFNGCRANIVYTWTRERFEQDIVLTEALPNPADPPWNLDPAHVVVEVYTEFIDPPEPLKTFSVLKSEADPVARQAMVEPDLVDEYLDFGAMIIGSGNAFASGAEPGARIPVAKNFEVRDGNRHVLVERVEYPAIQNQLALLAQAAPLTKEHLARIEAAMIRDRNGVRKFRLPSVPLMAAHKAKNPDDILSQGRKGAVAEGIHLIEKESGAMRWAQVSTPMKGFVLDFSALNSVSNALLKADTTYYISGTVILTGTTTIEGGTVVKFAPTNSPTIQVNGPVNCLTGPYRVATFTARDDTSIGEAIGSAALSGYYAATALDLRTATPRDLKYLRIAHANTALAIQSDAGGGHTFSHFQFVHCKNGIVPYNTTYALRNALMYDVLTNFSTATYQSTGTLEHVTVNVAAKFNESGGSQWLRLLATNSLLVSVTNYGYGYETNSSAVVSNLSAGSACFQTVGAGAHYLTTNSAHRDVGTTNINGDLALALKLKTTFPPTIFTNQITNSTSWSPIVQRDVDIPDIGFHYDPIDYAISNVRLLSTLTLNPGVVLAGYSNTYWPLVLDSGADLVAVGSPTNLVRMVRHNLVQEQASTNWSAAGGQLLAASDDEVISAPSARLRFVDFSAASAAPTLFSAQGGLRFTIKFQDCQFHGGQFVSSIADVYLTNCLFERVASAFSDDENTHLIAHNSTYYGGSLNLQHSGAGTYQLRNNLFDKTSISSPSENDANYNGYVTNFNANFNSTMRLATHGSGDVIQSTSSNILWETSWLGRFYLPTNSIFIDKGSTNADLLGFFHYTMLTNQVKETNTIIDMGFHYVAVDANGRPIDSDSDGIPDYGEDINGNGVLDSGETDPNNPDTDYDGRSDAQELIDATSPSNANDVLSVRLNAWRFSNTSWLSESGHAPRAFNNIHNVDAWSTKALQVNTNVAAYLNYRDIETNGLGNINCRIGSVRFWLKPNWSSCSGNGPGTAARLIELGNYSAGTGWWALFLSSNGTTLSFSSQTNGAGTTNFVGEINLLSNIWHEIVLTYTTNASILYLNGFAVTNGAGVAYFPNSSVRSAGFTIGSDASGSNQVKGVIEDLETFNYVLSASDVKTEYWTNEPAHLSGLKLWMKADSGITNNGSGLVSAWADLSGNNNFAKQVSDPNRAAFVTNVLNGLPVVRFDGANDYYDFQNNPVSGFTQGEVFVLIKAAADTPASSRTLWFFGTGGYSAYPDNQGNIREDFGRNSYVSFCDLSESLDQFHIYNVGSKSGEWTARLNGLVAYFQTNHVVGFNSGPLLGLFDTVFSGDIAELLIYNRVLSTDERHSVGRYLVGRYGMVSAPLTPTNLTATAVSSNQVSLSWNATLTNSAVSFVVERQSSGAAYSVLGLVNDGTSYLDNSGTAGTQYTYRVKANNYAGESDYSNEATATTSSDRVTMPVSDLTLWLKSDVGHAQGFVSYWLDQSGRGNHAVQTTPSYRPQAIEGAWNGKPAIRFDGTNDFFAFQSNPLLGATQAEVYAILKATVDPATATRVPWFFGGSGTPGSYPTTSGSIREDFGANSYVTFSDLSEPLNRYHLYNVASRAGLWTARLNGITAHTRADHAVSFPSDPLLSLNYDSFSGDIAELLIFKRVLTDAERATIEKYCDSRHSAVMPTIAITNPTPASFLVTATNHAINAVATAPDGNSVTQVQFYANSILIGTDTNSPYSLIWTNPVPGSYFLTAKVWDNSGVARISAEIAVTVLEDSDADGISDLHEIANGTDPFDANSPGTGPPSDPNDHTGPVITLKQPAFATPVP
jgi:hypothetical protein